MDKLEQPLISIIIPIYNGEKYLHPCLESIINQTYKNWELLLIDDGSTDGSAAICDEYCRDSRISVFHRRNGGQATARNEGIAMSKGEYISFVDCDDWLEPNMYESMLNALLSQQSDIVICGYFEEYQTRTKKVMNDGALMCYDTEDAVKRVLEGKIGSYLPFILFKREVIREPIIAISHYEDHATLFKWVSHASKIVVWHKAFYHYRQLEGSSLHSIELDKEINFFKAIKERYYYIVSSGLLPGWEMDNRRLYLHGCLKLAKDLARISSYDSQVRITIEEVRNEIKNFLPVKRNEISTKYYIRLHILLVNVKAFVCILRLSSLLSIRRWKKINLYR